METGLTTEVYILGYLALTTTAQIIEKFLNAKNKNDHENLKELERENRQLKQEISEVRGEIAKMQDMIFSYSKENAHLKGFISGINQSEENKAMFSQIMEDAKKQ
jgi:predicted nuclease with TOPRIM domain